MSDVARRAGTSAAVVSYVLSGGPRPVAAATRERVLRAADELGYRRNRIAAALRSGSSGMVGLVLPDTLNPHFAALGRHVERALGNAGALTVIANADFDPAQYDAAVRAFRSAQVDGLVLVPTGEEVDGTVDAGETPAVYVHHRPENSRLPLVAADNTASVTAAVQHLRHHGHTEIGFLAGERDRGPLGQRRAAWQDTRPAGPLLRCAADRAAARDLAAELASRGELPSALVVATDEQAIGVLAAAGARGVAVPGELALISCDGTGEAAFTVPALAAVQQPLAAAAEEAVALLNSPEAGDRAPAAQLVPRRSCGCPDPAAEPAAPGAAD
ncbi:LacI family DNA-binding transcriptional regulator [Salinifilum ghardaiensis]